MHLKFLQISQQFECIKKLKGANDLVKLVNELIVPKIELQEGIYRKKQKQQQQQQLQHEKQQQQRLWCASRQCTR